MFFYVFHITMLTHYDIPTEARQRAKWVQYQLKLRGKSFASIARSHGWSRYAVRACLHVPSYPQEVAVAEALGITPLQLFPERYDQDGTRLHRIQPKTIRGARKDNAKK